MGGARHRGRGSGRGLHQGGILRSAPSSPEALDERTGPRRTSRDRREHQTGGLRGGAGTMNGDVLEMVKRANPVDQELADAWAETDAADRIRRQIEDQTIAVELGKADIAPRTRRLSRGIRIAGLAAAL